MKLKYLFILVFVFPLELLAQDDHRPWYVPDHYKLQFAGNIGFLSVGAGYLHGHEKWETDLYFGFLPKQIGGDNILSLSAKTTYSPWKLKLGESYHLVPFSVGPYLSYSFGSQFDTVLPNEYPSGYYWWATSLRFGAFIGGRISKDLKPAKKFKTLEIYYELSTYDLEFISYAQNREYLDFTDIVSLALGIKLVL